MSINPPMSSSASNPVTGPATATATATATTHPLLDSTYPTYPTSASTTDPASSTSPPVLSEPIDAQYGQYSHQETNGDSVPNPAGAPGPASASASASASAPVPAPGSTATATAPRESSSLDEARQDRHDGIVTPPLPKCHLRALIISGQSHVFSFEPELTVGRVKEIIWSSWPTEWVDPAAPPSPAFLRLLYSGRILQDDSTLAANNIVTSILPSNPTVMHISVRSFSLKGDEGDPKKGGLHQTLSRRSSRRRAAQEEDAGGCKCVIM